MQDGSVIIPVSYGRGRLVWLFPNIFPYIGTYGRFVVWLWRDTARRGTAGRRVSSFGTEGTPREQHVGVGFSARVGRKPYRAVVRLINKSRSICRGVCFITPRVLYFVRISFLSL